MIVKAFVHHRCDAIITDRLRAMFTSKLWRMAQAIRDGGGRRSHSVIERWKLTKWKIEFTDNEVVPYSVGNKKQQNPIIVSALNHHTVLEDKLGDTTKKLNEVTNQLQILEKSQKRLSVSLIDKENKRPKRKAWSDCSLQQQRKRKRQITEDVKTALSFSEDDGFKALNIELVNTDTQETFQVACHQETETDESLNEKQHTVKKVLFVKERFNISNQAYHEMSMITDLPSSYSLSKTAKELDARCILQCTPGKTEGVQQSITERLRVRIRHMLLSNPSYQYRHIRVKITGDGTCVSRSVHLVVIAFSLIDFNNENPSSPYGCHVIALINATENYENLQESLTDIADELRHLNSINVDGKEFTVQFYLGGDWKFLALVTGIEAASSNFFCVWCKCPSDQKHITGIWSALNPKNGARTTNETQELSKQKRKPIDKFCCIRQPLFPMVEIKNIVPDTLHLFLRICDVLVNLLILELRRLDGIEKFSKVNDLKKLKNISKYENFLHDTCKISFHFYQDKESKNLKWRDLMGTEKLKLLKHIKIPTLFPRFPNGDKVQSIWKEFLEIYNLLRLKAYMSAEEIKAFELKTKKWLEKFLEVYQTKHVTPYIHLLTSHIPEMLELHGSLAAFTQQGVEKLNDIITQDYFKSTNHRDSLKQIMLKLNRLEDLSDAGCVRTKVKHVCSKCKQEGHNARTCKSL